MYHELRKAPDIGDGITLFVCPECDRAIAIKEGRPEVINPGDVKALHRWIDSGQINVTVEID